MPRFIFFLIFLGVSFLVIFGMNYFVYWQIKSVFHPSQRTLHFLRILLIILNSTFILGIASSRLFHWYLIFNFSFYWLGFISGAFFLALTGWLVGLIFPGHRVVILWVFLLLSLLIFLFSAYRGSQNPVFKTLTIRHADIPPPSNFRIVHLSDLHLTPNPRTEKRLRSIVERVNQAQPDLVVITGDILDENISTDHPIKEILAGIQSRCGVYLVTGNHEFYNGLERFTDFFSDPPFHILRNQARDISENIRLLGIDDPEIQDPGEYLNSDHNIFRQLNPDRFNILLFHRPNLFQRFSRLGIDLQLSGHTHNGQMFPMELLVNLVYKHPWGLYRSGNSYLYTSCGTGMWGPKMRTFSRSEIVQILLKPLGDAP